MKSNGLEITVEPLQLLYDLKLSLENNGIYLLSHIKPTGDNIMFTCPSHKDGQETKPSCGMLIHDMYKGDKLYEAGTVHCFTCDYTATLGEFISYCFGYMDGGIHGNNWLKANYTTQLNTKRKAVILNIERKITKKEYLTISDEILDEYRYHSNYLINRGISIEVLELFDIGYDYNEKCVTFPVRDLKGDVKWIQTRNINYKFYYIPSGITKTDFVFGAYECLKYNTDNSPVYIVESVINALTLWSQGKFAIALFGTGGGNQYDILKKLPFRHYVLALDFDDAGEDGIYKLMIKLHNRKLLSGVQYLEKGKDINDLGKDFLNLKIFPINY